MGSTPTTGIKLSPLAVSRLGGLVLSSGVEGSNSAFPPQRDANQPGGLFARARETPTARIKQPPAVSRLGDLVLFPGVEGSNSPFPPQRDANQPGGLFARARETPTTRTKLSPSRIPAGGLSFISRC